MSTSLHDAAKAFDQNLPRGDAAWVAETDAALFGALTRDLVPAPAHWLAGPLATLDLEQARALVRDLLRRRAAELGTGTVDEEDVVALPYDPATGQPETTLPAVGPKLGEALLRAARGERVHPLCVPRSDCTGCDCPDHPAGLHKPRARLTDWRKDATTDLTTLVAWWARWPDANVGSAGGRRQSSGGQFQRSAREEAITLITNLLTADADGRTSIPAYEFMNWAGARGISERTMRRAFRELGLKSTLKAGEGAQRWEWSWPPKAQERFWQQRQAAGLANIEEVERHLSG